ncbi:MoxR family ATPase [Streptosporangiaceae bacterium NEAU-GS5]|nr:MoxR family ATPase [Streptosporangiaceae bacterium NEAU-GS5]
MSPATTPEAAESFKVRFDQIAENVGRVILGNNPEIRYALVCLFSSGHLLIEGPPGVAKTTLAKAIARSVSQATVRRIQFTPDLLPGDIVGVQIYRQATNVFEFHPGPVFANLVIGDEINRASPRTQSALLESMGEGQVTVDGVTHVLPRPFFCVATRNPGEHLGTYGLPEAQLDRFQMRVLIGYPDLEFEVDIIANGLARKAPDELEAVVSLADIMAMTATAKATYTATPVQDYVARIVAATRKHPGIQLGASPRAAIALATSAQAYACSAGRNYVTGDDVKTLAVPVLSHRLALTQESMIQGRTAEDLLMKILDATPAPWANGM